nr:flagellar filament capping protein FliD [Galbitalea soli]
MDTTSIINSLISADSAPQTLLKTKATTGQTLVTALQALNTSLAALATQATTASASTAYNVFTATSSATSVTATTTTSASAGSISLSVAQVAQAQVGVTAGVTAFATPAVFTIVGSDGTKTEVTAVTGSPADVASAINKAGAGVTALSVASGKDATTGDTLYRLQLSGTSTGSAGAFTVYEGSSTEVAAGTATDLLTQTGAAIIQSAQDASVTLWAGSAAAQTITSASNTFTDLLPGVSVTISKPEASPVTLTIAQDNAAVTKNATDLITALNGIFSTVASKTTVSTSTSSTGAVTTTAGAFTGDPTIRTINDALFSAASQPVGGLSPQSIGITVTRDGTLTFDSAAFSAALAKDPAGTQSMLSTIAGRVAAVTTAASDPISGTITQEITGQQSSLKDLNSQIADWDTRLAARRASLQTQFTAMEVALNSLKSQSSWLTSQLSALSGSSSTSSSSSGG